MSKKQDKSSKESFEFAAETGKILQLMIHSLYAHKEIFLRELISNASDACDKLRYASLTNPELVADGQETLNITVSVDDKNQILTLTDHGIGMNKDELIENLGTIARSGTQRFLEAMTGDNTQDIQLIGQFGVGFYSSFMVADQVDVQSKKAGDKKAYSWQSKADGTYTIEETEIDQSSGTIIRLHIKDDCKEFLDRHRIEHIVKTYSDHVTFPVIFIDDKDESHTLNTGEALWTKQKSDISDEQYHDFYKHVSHAGDTPWMTLHNKVEGNLDYTSLLFIPSHPPFDLFHPDRKTRLKLYVKRVFISEDVELIPSHFRFLRGLVDSQDLPLNISRETLQHNHMIEKIKNAIVSKVIGELKKKAEKDPKDYETFWGSFGATLKEGLCESMDAKREKLLEICRFYSSNDPQKLISIDEYINSMKDDQKVIYFVTGDNVESLMHSPQMEGFIKNNINVLLLTDSVDDFWVSVNHEYKETPLQSITRADIDLSDKDKDDTPDDDTQYDTIVALFKEALGDKVADVRISKKLTQSPACLSVPEGGMDIRMERFLIEQKQLMTNLPKILEINPEHPLVKHINEHQKKSQTSDLIVLLFEQACIAENEPLADAHDYIKRTNSFLEKALA